MAKFGYYKRLGARQRRIYDQSDAVTSVRVPAALPLQDGAARLMACLAADDRPAAEAAAQRLADGLTHRLHVKPVAVRVLAVRPSTSREELHGLYEFGGGRTKPVITVWMRTAQRRQVVAFRTFLRTFLHEVAHHLDYQMLKLADSYHTQGFYKRAESLYRQVVPRAGAAAAGPPAESRTEAAGARAVRPRPVRPARVPAARPVPKAVPEQPWLPLFDPPAAREA